MTAGDVRRNPDTGEVAIRTTNSDEGERAARAWLIASTTRGARFATTATVETWDDIYPGGS